MIKIDAKRIWLISDTHLGVRTNSREWMDIIDDYFKNTFIPLLKKESKPGDVLVHCGDVFEEYLDNKLQDELYEIFIGADFYEDYSKNKKVVRSDVSRVYYYFDDNLKNTKAISPIDKFVAIAEFMSITYEQLYEELAPVYKEALLRELDQKYKIFTKRNIKRLF